MDKTRRRKRIFTGLYVLVAILAFWAVQRMQLEPPPQEVTYSELMMLVREGKVDRAEIAPNTIVATMKAEETVERDERSKEKEKRVVAVRLPEVDNAALLQTLEARGVKLVGKLDTTPWWQTLFGFWLLPLLFLFLIYWGGMRQIGKAGGPLAFAKSKAKLRELHDQAGKERVTFNDVAGVDDAEAELKEVVDFLKTPQKYRDIGARIPKGVLLVGPPGTGKTLLAKAVAGEAGVPFFSLSGSEFVEMFVGVGAARMRDLFEQAKLRAPCIVFIDELDAIGRSRAGVAAMATHDEREQTLNQLLVEMDGFDSSAGVVIMGATNRPEVLDRALLRAGRFDRHIVVDRPDVDGREEILGVHARKVKLAKDVSLRVVARRTPGMVGADLQNVVNEAALAAARRGALVVEHKDFEEAIDRIQLGNKKRGRAMNEDERRRVAFHECGHALVALSVEHADPVHRVTIIPRSIGALGATLQLPTEDRYLVTRRELEDRICVMLGGRAAEELTSDDISSGAQNDLERATETARQMVCRFGMSERLGAVTFGRPVGARFLEAPVMLGEERNFSERTAQAIDDEVRRIVETQHERAKEILLRRRKELERVADRLLNRETLEKEELERLLSEEEDIGEPEPEPRQTTSVRDSTAAQK